MNNILYIITGPCGVGKSTISKKLAEQFDLSCHINADLLYHMVVGGIIEPWKDKTKVDLLWRNIISLVNNFTSEDYIVVLDYIVFPERLKHLNELKLKLKLRVKYVVLTADEDTIRERVSLRPEDYERAIELLEEFKGKGIDDKYLIDTSSKSIEKVVEIIMKEDRFILA